MPSQPLLLSQLPSNVDERGILIAIEGGIDLPFDIARVYYLLGSSGAARGFHAHLALDQLLVCAAGSVRVIIDDGRDRQEVVLDRPDVGLHVGKMKWREMHDFSPDCVLLVLASAHHDEADYIHDYRQFLATVESGPQT